MEKHYIELLNNCIDYFWQIWNNESADEILDKFKTFGFTDEDLKKFWIIQELEHIKEESEENK